MCKVLFDYKKENDDELDLGVGDLVEFHKEVGYLIFYLVRWSF